MLTQPQKNGPSASPLERLERLLAVKQLQINSMFEVTQAVNNNFSASALYKIYEYILRAQMGVNKLALYVKEEDWECAFSTGMDDETIRINPQEDLLPFKMITNIKNLGKESLKDFEVILPVVHKDTPLAYALIGDIKNDSDSDTLDDRLKFIQAVINVIVVAIENKKLFKSKLEQEVMKKELELAAQMQTMLIPNSFPTDERLTVSGVYQPHRDIGGDYYDFIELDEHRYAICMSDISGKGVAAGLLMSNFQANLRMLINKGYNLDQLVHMLNLKVAEITKGEKYITFFIGIMDFQTRKLEYVNAGHNPGVLINEGEMELLTKGSTFLGMFDELPFVNVGTAHVAGGSLLVTYTDGLTELRNPQGEIYDDDRLLEFVQKNHQLEPEEFNKNLLSEINEFKLEEQYVDDVSLLTCRFR